MTMSIGIRHSITSGQCRAARALLDITQPELAEAAGLGLSTIVDFEKSRRDVSRAAVHAIQKALEKAGIQFVAKNGGGTGRPAADITGSLCVLSVIGQRELRLPPTVPLITRSLDVARPSANAV